MGQAKTAYDEYVMDHIKNARSYRVLEQADRELPVTNPMCGDKMTVQLLIEDGRVREAVFQCECCGISMASASMMMEWLQGRLVEEAADYARGLLARLASRGEAEEGEAGELERALFSIVREHPSRARCAALPWTALGAM